jgi:prevent-host-death family protein
MTEITASQFKARCLSLLDEVSESGVELIVTKRGEPVARVGPVDPDASLAGSAEQLVDDEELIAPLDERWEAEAGPA